MQDFKKKKKKKKLPAKLLVVRNWGKMAHCSNQQQLTSFGNFIATFVCNDTPFITDYIKFQVLKLI